MGPKNPILIIEAPILSPHRSLVEPWKEPDLIGTSSAGEFVQLGSQLRDLQLQRQSGRVLLGLYPGELPVNLWDYIGIIYGL